MTTGSVKDTIGTTSYQAELAKTNREFSVKYKDLSEANRVVNTAALENKAKETAHAAVVRDQISISQDALKKMQLDVKPADNK